MIGKTLGLVVLASCGAATAPTALGESRRGPAAGPPGRVLVMTATCGSIEARCDHAWIAAVDQIVLGGLDYRGFDTIEPSTLRKDERTRQETITEFDSTQTQELDSGTRSAGLVGVLPVVSGSSTESKLVTITASRERTIVLEGASYDDLRLEDRRALLTLAGADSVVTTRIIVGAQFGTWTVRQDVEVVVKIAAATTGEMRHSTRCVASSTDHDTPHAAIESAARCAARLMAME